MTKQNIAILPQSLVNYLVKSEFQMIEVRYESTIIYEGHTPHAGYLLLEGEAILCKRNRPLQKLQNRSLIGVEELLGHKAFKWDLRLKPGSKLLVLDKSTVKEILENQQHEAHQYLSSLIA